MDVMLILALALLLAWPLGAYMTGIFSGQKHWSDKVFGPVENGIFKILGLKASEGMNWKSYGIAFLISNLVLGVIAFLLLMFQHLLPMNPDGIGPLSWDLALHTACLLYTSPSPRD